MLPPHPITCTIPNSQPTSSMTNKNQPRHPPELPDDPLDFLCRSWTSSAFHIPTTLPRAMAGNSFVFAPATISDIVADRIMAQADASPLNSGRPSHSGSPFNCVGGDSHSDSPPLSPSHMEGNKHNTTGNSTKPNYYKVTGKTIRRWLKDRREKKKEATRSEKARLNAALSVASVASAVAAVISATAVASGSSKDERNLKTDRAVVAAATLVAAQCMEAAKSIGAEHEHLASVFSSVVNVRTPEDVVTLTAAATNALRGVAALQARTLNEVWNVSAVIPIEKGDSGNNISHRQNRRREKELASNNRISADEFIREEEKKFFGPCYQELVARGGELLKRTRKDALHWKIVSVYISPRNQVTLEMKSRCIAGTIIKKKKSIVTEVCKGIRAWPGRQLLEGGEQRRYFGLKTIEQRVIEFECQSKREYKIWTQGVTQLLDIVKQKNSLK